MRNLHHHLQQSCACTAGSAPSKHMAHGLDAATQASAPLRPGAWDKLLRVPRRFSPWSPQRRRVGPSADSPPQVRPPLASLDTAMACKLPTRRLRPALAREPARRSRDAHLDVWPSDAHG